jgi:HAE1 family hydrophobic/amphiphilic exporter-1
MIPLALKMEDGAETRAPIAVVLIGGLVTSMLLTLVLVPVMYTYLDDLAGLPALARARVPAWLRLRRRPLPLPFPPIAGGAQAPTANPDAPWRPPAAADEGRGGVAAPPRRSSRGWVAGAARRDDLA